VVLVRVLVLSLLAIRMHREIILYPFIAFKNVVKTLPGCETICVKSDSSRLLSAVPTILLKEVASVSSFSACVAKM
jgi:hypothetical protein